MTKFALSTALHASAAGLLAACVLAVTPASAASAESRSVTVSTADLDLGTPDGAATLAHRIARAAERACGPRENGSLAEQALFAACRDKAIADAQVKVTAMIAATRSRSLYATVARSDRAL